MNNINKDFFIATESDFKDCIKKIILKYDEEVDKNKKLQEENTILKSDLAKEEEIKNLNSKISSLQTELSHYSIPDYIWNKFESIRIENNIPYWDKIEIVPTYIADSYTVKYKNHEFTEYN